MRAPRQERTAVAVCCCKGEAADALDLAAVCRSVAADCPGVAVRLVDDLCSDVGRLCAVTAEPGIGRLVVAACSADEEVAGFRRVAAAADLDPYGVQVFDLRALASAGYDRKTATARAVAGIRALVRRAAAFPGVHPDQIALRLPRLEDRLSRRGLFGLGRPRYRVVPRVDRHRCAAQLGCTLCREACPAGAVAWEGGAPAIAGTRCDGCGACLPACPFGAVEFPTWSPAELKAEVAGLLEGAQGATGPSSPAPAIAFVAAPDGNRPLHPLPDGVYAVALPSLDLATPLLILQSLLLGAAGVALIEDGDGPASGQAPARWAQAAAFVRRLLAPAAETGRVQVLPAAAPSGSLFTELAAWRQALPREGLIPASAAEEVPDRLGEAILAMQRAGIAIAPVVVGEDVPLGWVRVDADRCTLCGVCAARCPVGALSLSIEGERCELRFRHPLCTACGLCVRPCPERAIAVERAVRAARLDSSPETVAAAPLRRCRNCGESLGPATLALRTGVRLGRPGSSRGEPLCGRCSIGRQLLNTTAAGCRLRVASQSKGGMTGVRTHRADRADPHPGDPVPGDRAVQAAGAREGDRTHLQGVPQRRQGVGAGRGRDQEGGRGAVAGGR